MTDTLPPSHAVTGPNSWLVDEMYERYLANPNSVSASWQEFFADYSLDKSALVSAKERAATTPTTVPSPAPATTSPGSRSRCARMAASPSSAYRCC